MEELHCKQGSIGLVKSNRFEVSTVAAFFVGVDCVVVVVEVVVVFGVVVIGQQRVIVG